MRISDWSSDVCSSDLGNVRTEDEKLVRRGRPRRPRQVDAGAEIAAEADTAAKRHGTGREALVESSRRRIHVRALQDRQSAVEGKRGSVRVDDCGRRNIKQKNQ